MWTYHILARRMTAPDGNLRPELCYSGHGTSKNDPSKCGAKGEGPLPPGKYTIGPMFDDQHLGKHVMALTPHPGNDMMGRGGFYLHGDSQAHPGEASEGCIVEMSGFTMRTAMNASPDKILEVIA